MSNHTHVIFQHSGSSVGWAIPAEGFDLDDVINNPNLVPTGAVYEKVHSSVFPDSIFRDAWEWDGPGQPIIEDLEKSKPIAIDIAKKVAVQSAKKAVDAELVGEFVPTPASSIKDAYLACRSHIQNATSVSEIKSCLNAFTATYSV